MKSRRWFGLVSLLSLVFFAVSVCAQVLPQAGAQQYKEGQRYDNGGVVFQPDGKNLGGQDIRKPQVDPGSVQPTYNGGQYYPTEGERAPGVRPGDSIPPQHPEDKEPEVFIQPVLEDEHPQTVEQRPPVVDPREPEDHRVDKGVEFAELAVDYMAELVSGASHYQPASEEDRAIVLEKLAKRSGKSSHQIDSMLNEFRLNLAFVVYEDGRRTRVFASESDGVIYPIAAKDFVANFDHLRENIGILRELSAQMRDEMGCYVGSRVCSMSVSAKEAGIEFHVEGSKVAAVKDGTELPLFFAPEKYGNGAVVVSVDPFNLVLFGDELFPFLGRIEGLEHVPSSKQEGDKSGSTPDVDPNDWKDILDVPVPEDPNAGDDNNDAKAKKDKKKDRDDGDIDNGDSGDSDGGTVEGDTGGSDGDGGTGGTGGSGGGNGGVGAGNGSGDTKSPGGDDSSDTTAGGCENKDLSTEVRIHGFGTGADLKAAVAAAKEECESSGNKSGEGEAFTHCSVKCPEGQENCGCESVDFTMVDSSCGGDPSAIFDDEFVNLIFGQGSPSESQMEIFGGAGFAGEYPEDEDTFWAAVFGTGTAVGTCICEEGAAGSTRSPGGGGGSTTAGFCFDQFLKYESEKHTATSKKSLPNAFAKALRKCNSSAKPNVGRECHNKCSAANQPKQCTGKLVTAGGFGKCTIVGSSTETVKGTKKKLYKATAAYPTINGQGLCDCYPGSYAGDSDNSGASGGGSSDETEQDSCENANVPDSAKWGRHFTGKGRTCRAAGQDGKRNCGLASSPPRPSNAELCDKPCQDANPEGPDQCKTGAPVSGPGSSRDCIVDSRKGSCQGRWKNKTINVWEKLTTYAYECDCG